MLEISFCYIFSIEAEMSEFQTESSCFLVKQRQIVQYTIDSIVGDTSMPEIIDDMLKGPWNDYMNHIIASKGQHSKEWVDAEELVKLLLWSLAPKIESIERKCLRNKAYELMTGLKQGLELVDFGPYKTALFFEMLKEIHLEIMKNGFWLNEKHTKQKAVEKIHNEISPNQESCDVIDITQGTNKNEAKIIEHTDINNENIGIELQNKPINTEIKITEVDDCTLSVQTEQTEKIPEISKLDIGTWVEIRSGESVFKCKISIKESKQQKYVFVNRHGVKVSEKTFSDLENDLENGDIKILDDAFLFENALSSVIGVSRAYDKH